MMRYPTNTVDTVVPVGCLPLFWRLPEILVIGLWAAVQFIPGFGAIAPGAGTERGGDLLRVSR